MNWTNILTVAIILSIIAVLSKIECAEYNAESFPTKETKCPYGFTFADDWETNYCVRSSCARWEFR